MEAGCDTCFKLAFPAGTESNWTLQANFSMTLFSTLEETFKANLGITANAVNFSLEIAVFLVSGTKLIQCTNEGSAAWVL